MPGASVTSADSAYGDTFIGVYVLNGITYAYTTTVPGFSDPITNVGTLSISAPGATAISGAPATTSSTTAPSQASGAASVGINAGTYGVVTNNGTVSVAARAARRCNDGEFGSL